MDLIVDASAAIHAENMISNGIRLLDRIDTAFEHPVYGLTRNVRTECVRNRVADWLDTLDQLGRLEVVKNDFRSAKRRLDSLRQQLKGKAPGLEDSGLLDLAEKRAVPLLTDDEGLYRAALNSKIRCGDLFDFCLGAISVGHCKESDVCNFFSFLAQPTPHFMPLHWRELREAGAKWPDNYADLARKRRDPAGIASDLFGG